jgi:UDP-glucose 4-epimerase
MKTFLITGGAGFIGTNLSHHLVGKGYRVIIVDDLSAGKRERLPASVEFHQLDVRDTETLTKLCHEVDVVVHLAALPQTQFSIEEPQQSHDVNVNGTLSVLEAARMAGVRRFVYAASAGAYGDQSSPQLTVDLTPKPKTPYALHKYIGEQYAALWSELYGLKTVSLRFFNVYGPHLDPEGAYALVIGKFLKQAADGMPLTVTGDGEQTRDFIHVKDIATAIEAAAFAIGVGKGEVFNVGSGVETSINSIAQMVSSDIVHVPARVEIRRTLADISSTKEKLEWSPTMTLEQGILELKQEFGLL